MHKRFIITAAFFAGLGVALGAFGAHGLQKAITDEKILHGFQTAVQYQLYHALALLAVAILFEKFSSKWMRWAGYSFITGIILFSGSLYLLTFLKVQESSAVKFVGPVTPVGGVMFILGWIFLLVAAVKRKQS